MKLRIFAVLATLAVLAAFVPVALALTHSNANLNGFYIFQMQGTTNSYGYLTCDGSGNCVWTDVMGDCPVGQNCQQSAFTKFTYGTMSFDGNGHVLSATFTEYHPVGGPGPFTKTGTATGHYSIGAGGNGTVTLTIAGQSTASQPISIYLGQVDPTSGVAIAGTVHQVSTTGNAGSTEAGMFFHQ